MEGVVEMAKKETGWELVFAASSHPYLVQSILYNRGTFESSPDSPAYNRLNSYPKPLKDDRLTYNFKLCNSTAHIQFLIDRLYPDSRPDILIDPGLQNKGFSFTLNELKSYVNWDPRNPGRYTALLNEIYQKYKNFEKGLVLGVKNSRVHFQLSCLSHDSTDIEYYYSRDAHGQQIQLVIPIKPELQIEQEVSLVKLHIDYNMDYNTDSNPRIETKITLDPYPLKLPQYKPRILRVEDLIDDYVEEVKRGLFKQVQSLNDSFHKKKYLVLSLSNEYKKYLIECDLLNYGFVVLLFETKKDIFGVKILFPDDFLNEKPEVSIISLTDNINLPKSEHGVGAGKRKIVAMKWDQKWDQEESYRRLTEQIFDGLSNFDKNETNNNK